MSSLICPCAYHVQPDKLARLKIARKEAKDAMNEDIEKLARFKLHHKELTGIEGVDELSRAQEQISAVERELNDNDKMP